MDLIYFTNFIVFGRFLKITLKKPQRELRFFDNLFFEIIILW